MPTKASSLAANNNFREARHTLACKRASNTKSQQASQTSNEAKTRMLPHDPSKFAFPVESALRLTLNKESQTLPEKQRHSQQTYCFLVEECVTDSESGIFAATAPPGQQSPNKS